jgi:nitronate monooxygenase
MDMPSLSIGPLTAKLPIIQGGMAVRISLAPLAAAVAQAGGIGIIAGTGLSPEEMRAEIRAARAVTSGIIGVNVLVAYRHFAEVIQTAIAEGIDLVIAGAGFSRDVFDWTREAGIPMVPVVGSERVAEISQRFGASAVVVEGVEAGGHLGTDESVRDLLPRILDAVDLPVIAAGDIVTGGDIYEMISAGAAGVQMGTRFCDTVESSAPLAFKQMHIDATADDIIVMQSPVGLPGRAIRNPFTDELAQGIDEKITGCIACLKRCGKQYCIMDKLIRAQEGDVVDGLVFSGNSAARIHDIIPVRELIDRLVAEYRAASAAAAGATA